MRVAIDVSQIVDGTGVSDYTTSLVKHLDSITLLPFAFSLTKSQHIKSQIPHTRVFPIGRKHTDLLFNRFHLPIDPLIGKVDILHASDWTQPRTSAKTVTTIHDLTPFLFPGQTHPEIVAVHTRKMKHALLECDKFICVSRNTANDLKKIFSVPESKISVIYEASAQKLDLTPKKSPYKDYVLAMGSKQPRKNIPRLITAYKKYKTELKLPSKLVITGENNLSSIEPDIIFTGFVSDQQLVNLFASAEVFVYPSLYEGFGQPVLEGFQFSVPVVAANTSSIPEVAGDAAVLVDPYNEKSIAEGIKQAIVAKKHLVNAGKKQLTKFSWTQTAQETMNLYQSLLC